MKLGSIRNRYVCQAVLCNSDNPKLPLSKYAFNYFFDVCSLISKLFLKNLPIYIVICLVMLYQGDQHLAVYKE